MELILYDKYIILGIASLFAGFVDSIAGGGGLITLPALLSVGIPPHILLWERTSFKAASAALQRLSITHQKDS